jgi:hypothetical protein
VDKAAERRRRTGFGLLYILFTSAIILALLLLLGLL